MAAVPGCSKSAATKTSETSDYDPSLDFYSDKFDPLKALQTSNIKIPVPKAKLYDNLAKYESVQRGIPTGKSAAKAKQTQAANLKFERKFEPHQMPLPVKRKEFTARNVFTNMEKLQGPLVRLKLCVNERHRLKVWTRHSHGIRGYCLAFCVAFDKHWNMALEDVTEVWTRPRSRKVPALDSLVVLKKEILVKREVVPPKVTITKTTKKLEYCERYVPQLIVRGEQIAFINILK